jgi:hypothetical protein
VGFWDVDSNCVRGQARAASSHRTLERYVSALLYCLLKESIVKVIFTSPSEPTGLLVRWRERFGPAEFVPSDSLIASLKEEQSGLVAEAIVIDASEIFHFLGSPPDGYVGGFWRTEPFAKLVLGVRQLDSCVAMDDGRKWNSVPIVLIFMESLSTNFWLNESLETTIIFSRGDVFADLEKVRQEIVTYRRQILDELDNLGFLVSFENGRYRVGPALTPRKRQVEGRFYFGPADTRPGVPGKYYTVDRENIGIQYEVEMFEALINRPDVSEADIQIFLEENPHFLLMARIMQALPHVQLPDDRGNVLIPDFILKPIVALQELRDSNWEVLDLKRPQAKLLAGPSNHRRFSAEVYQAITQVKNYRQHFENPQNTAAVTKLLGHALKHPRLAVLIGRMPPSSEIELLEQEQAREPQVRIVTYDEILESQKKLVR